MARIDTSTIEGYEGMTPEEKVAALEGHEYDDGSAELQRLRSASDKASKEAAEWKRKYQAQLSDEERKAQEAAEERKKMEEELDRLRHDKAKGLHKAKLLADGYDEELADASAEALVNGDTDTFFANQKKFLAARDKALKEKLMSGTRRPGAGGTPKTYSSKEEIMEIADTTERRAAIAANPELCGLT